MSAPITPDEARQLLEGATKGPWHADGEPWNRIVWSPDGNRVCFMAHSSGLNDDRDIVTSNLAAAAPALARAYLAEHEARVAAEAAQALVLERAAEAVEATEPPFHRWLSRKACVSAIRNLAPASGVEALAALREERDTLVTQVEALRAARDAAVSALNCIRELNMTAPDKRGEQWAESDLIEQEIVFALKAIVEKKQ